MIQIAVKSSRIQYTKFILIGYHFQPLVIISEYLHCGLKSSLANLQTWLDAQWHNVILRRGLNSFDKILAILTTYQNLVDILEEIFLMLGTPSWVIREPLGKS